MPETTGLHVTLRVPRDPNVHIGHGSSTCAGSAENSPQTGVSPAIRLAAKVLFSAQCPRRILLFIHGKGFSTGRKSFDFTGQLLLSLWAYHLQFLILDKVNRTLSFLFHLEVFQARSTDFADGHADAVSVVVPDA
jgi:hypothetical protein